MGPFTTRDLSVPDVTEESYEAAVAHLAALSMRQRVFYGLRWEGAVSGPKRPIWELASIYGLTELSMIRAEKRLLRRLKGKKNRWWTDPLFERSPALIGALQARRDIRQLSRLQHRESIRGGLMKVSGVVVGN